MIKNKASSTSPRPAATSDDFMDLVQAAVSGDSANVARLLAREPALARRQAKIGASRASAETYFFEEIRHYLYGGDTALHMAAAAFRAEIVRLLLDAGADTATKNRRGAEPLHYAADANHWNPDAQASTISTLIRAGADPNALDKSGVAPLHRAVRTRSAAAVKALLDGGAEVRLKNKSGSTPLHLAVQNTGRGGTGEPHAIEQQRAIIEILLESGATADDTPASTAAM